MLQFHIPHAALVFKFNVTLIKGNRRQKSEIQVFKKTDIQDKSGGKTNRGYCIDYLECIKVRGWLRIPEIRTGACPELRFVYRKKESVVQKAVVVSNQVLPFALNCFPFIRRFLKLVLRLSSDQQRKAAENHQYPADGCWFWALHRQEVTMKTGNYFIPV